MKTHPMQVVYMLGQKSYSKAFKTDSQRLAFSVFEFSVYGKTLIAVVCVAHNLTRVRF